MNAYELYQAAFDSANDSVDHSIDHIQSYADGAFDLYVSDEVAQKILDCITNEEAENEKNGELTNNHYHCVQSVLETIEI